MYTNTQSERSPTEQVLLLFRLTDHRLRVDRSQLQVDHCKRIKWFCLHEAQHNGRPSASGFGSFRTACRHAILSRLPRLSTMDADSKRQKRREKALTLLNAAIDAMNLAKEASSGTPAPAVFGSVGIILTTIRVGFFHFFGDELRVHIKQDSMANKTDYVDLGIACTDVCKALHRGMNGKTLDGLTESVREALEQLTK